MYDVGEKRCHKVFKICKKYLTHYQLSVFRGKITPSQIIKLKAEINSIINKEEDSVAIIKFLNDHYFEEESLGKKQSLVEQNLFV